MTNRIKPTNLVGIRQTPNQGRSADSNKTSKSENLAFEDFLKEAKTKDVQFSKHASQRIEQRSIEMTKTDMELLSDGISRAAKKGSKESLLLMGNTAFVVNVADRKVITAVDEEGMKEKTFTNIDSAILIKR